MAEDQAMEKISSEDEDDKNRKKKKEDYLSDPEFFSCVLQPSPADSDPEYIGIRRLLLHRKAQSGVVLRKVCFTCVIGVGINLSHINAGGIASVKMCFENVPNY